MTKNNNKKNGRTSSVGVLRFVLVIIGARLLKSGMDYSNTLKRQMAVVTTQPTTTINTKNNTNTNTKTKTTSASVSLAQQQQSRLQTQQSFTNQDGQAYRPRVIHGSVHHEVLKIVKQAQGEQQQQQQQPIMLEWWQKEKPLLTDWPYLKQRNDIHPWLDKLNYTAGIEVGVQRGVLAKRTLLSWKSCREYKLVDVWGSIEGYKEPGVDSNAAKNRYLQEARNRLQPWTDQNITEFYVMRSTDAAPLFPNDHFDYVYIDARHDYCAVQQDMEAYWPKVRPGGILAGHDFIDAPSAMAILGPQEDWSTCEDGVTVEPRAVKGAVEDFAAKYKLDILTTHEGFDTWLIQKPYEQQEVLVTTTRR